jgi:drug/metabolite transporter (DMT)-like permease
MPSGRGKHMRATAIVGIVLIVIGVAMLVYQGITYTTREKVLEVGPVEVQAERQKTIPLPPLVGGIALAGGIVLVLVGARRA